MKIKYLLLVICISGSSLIYAQNDTFKSLLNKYENENNVTIVSISKAMLSLMPSNIKTGNVDLQNILPKIESLLIITSEKRSIAKQRMMNNDFKLLIDNNRDYEELMRIKSDQTDVIFNVIKRGDLISELIMIVNDEQNFVAMQLLGNFTMEEIQKIAQGAEVL